MTAHDLSIPRMPCKQIELWDITSTSGNFRPYQIQTANIHFNVQLIPYPRGLQQNKCREWESNLCPSASTGSQVQLTVLSATKCKIFMRNLLPFRVGVIIYKEAVMFQLTVSKITFTSTVCRSEREHAQWATTIQSTRLTTPRRICTML